jgi:hypothetical protein
VHGGEGFLADPRRLRAVGIDEGGSVQEQMDQQPRGGVHLHSGPSAIAPSIGVLAATGSRVSFSLSPERAGKHD